MFVDCADESIIESGAYMQMFTTCSCPMSQRRRLRDSLLTQGKGHLHPVDSFLEVRWNLFR